MTTPRHPIPTQAATEPEDPTATVEPWLPQTTAEEPDDDDHRGDSGTLTDYFARMRERGLLD